MPRRSPWCLFAVLVLFLGCLGGLAATSVHIAPGRAFVLYSLGFALLYRLVFHDLRDSPFGWSPTRAIIVISVGLHLLFLQAPLNDDVCRYAWEGRQVVAGENPYLQPPIAWRDTAAGDPIYEGINHPDYPAIYPPLALLVFGAVAKAGDWAGWSPTTLLNAYRLLFLVANLGVVLIAAALLRAWHRPPAWLALYAWNPLVLYYGVGEGHFDALQVLAIATGLLAMARGRRWWWLGYLALGSAVMIKYVAVILLPLVVTRRNWRWAPVAAGPLLAFVPFADPAMFNSLGRFATELHANDFLPRLLRLLGLGNGWLVALFAAGLATLWLLGQASPERTMLLAWGWLVLCLPTVHPWYLLPIMLLMLYTPNRAWLVLGAAMGCQFWILHGQATTGQWRELPWVWPAMYLPFLAVAVWDLGRLDQPWFRRWPVPKRLDVVVPTLNEAAHLPALLASLREAAARTSLDVRCIIADGGSDDGTPAFARQAGCTVVELPGSGRGQQIAAGIAAGEAELVLLLHADVALAPDALSDLLTLYRQQPATVWGILGHRYDRPSAKMRLIEFSNRLRYNLAGIAFGDQGIHLRREALPRVGGMPTTRLMEDVELSLRLGDKPRPFRASSSLVVSTRRWQRKRFTGYTLQVLYLVAAYLLLRRLGWPAERLGDWMYRLYYRPRRT